MDAKKTKRTVDTLKPREVAEHRAKLLKAQNYRCFLCKKPITTDQAALDHDHGTGQCREVLHRNCNSIEGRVLSWLKRGGVAPLQFLKNLVQYWEQDYSQNPIHPNHKTEGAKHVLKLKRRLRKAKRVSTKARLKREIQEHLQQMEQETDL